MVVRGGRRIDRTYPSEAEARAVADQARRQLAALTGATVGDAVEGFIRDGTTRGLRATTLKSYRISLGLLLEDIWDMPVATMTPAKATALYANLRESVAVDTHRNALRMAKQWGRWCVTAGHTRTSAFEKIAGTGRRKKGKPKLTISEARTLVATCISLAALPRHDAIATLAYLLLGCRASELMFARVRDLDDDGRLLWIREAKTEAGIRTLEVPDMLRPHLLAMAAGKKPDAYLFGHSRQWAHTAVRAMCSAAGVPLVPPHGLRGTHATLARAAGATAHLVAGALGHASEAVQAAHYVDAGVAEKAQQRATLRLLEGGKKP